MTRPLFALVLFASACASSRPPDVVHIVRDRTFTTCDLELVTAEDRAMSRWECTPIVERVAR
jgi:hypothetical protein